MTGFGTVYRFLIPRLAVVLEDHSHTADSAIVSNEIRSFAWVYGHTTSAWQVHGYNTGLAVSHGLFILLAPDNNQQNARSHGRGLPVMDISKHCCTYSLALSGAPYVCAICFRC